MGKMRYVDESTMEEEWVDMDEMLIILGKFMEYTLNYESEDERTIETSTTENNIMVSPLMVCVDKKSLCVGISIGDASDESKIIDKPDNLYKITIEKVN